MSNIGKFVVLPVGTTVINTLAPIGTGVRELVLKEASLALVDSTGTDSFSVILFRQGRSGHFLREEVAYHTFVKLPLAKFQTFVAFEDAVKAI